MGARADLDDGGLEGDWRMDRPLPKRGASARRTSCLTLRVTLFLLLPVLFSGCEPIVDIAGVYFPGWLVSTVVGVIASYGIVVFLGRKSTTRKLGDSGLFFISLVVGIALIVWWVFFSSF